MKGLIISLLAVSVLAGCAQMHHSVATTHTSTRTIDGSMGFHIRTPYGGWPENEEASRLRATEKLDRYSKGICKHGYAKTDEQESVFVTESGYGSGKVKNLFWEIKCNKPEQPSS